VNHGLADALQSSKRHQNRIAMTRRTQTPQATCRSRTCRWTSLQLTLLPQLHFRDQVHEASELQATTERSHDRVVTQPTHAATKEAGRVASVNAATRPVPHASHSPVRYLVHA